MHINLVHFLHWLWIWKGVHNVMEPAIYGNLICFGPNYQILEEAIELVNEKLAISINNSNELTNIRFNI